MQLRRLLYCLTTFLIALYCTNFDLQHGPHTSVNGIRAVFTCTTHEVRCLDAPNVQTEHTSCSDALSMGSRAPSWTAGPRRLIFHCVSTATVDSSPFWHALHATIIAFSEGTLSFAPSTGTFLASYCRNVVKIAPYSLAYPSSRLLGFEYTVRAVRSVIHYNVYGSKHGLYGRTFLTYVCSFIEEMYRRLLRVVCEAYLHDRCDDVRMLCARRALLMRRGFMSRHDFRALLSGWADTSSFLFKWRPVIRSLKSSCSSRVVRYVDLLYTRRHSFRVPDLHSPTWCSIIYRLVDVTRSIMSARRKPGAGIAKRIRTPSPQFVFSYLIEKPSRCHEFRYASKTATEEPCAVRLPQYGGGAAPKQKIISRSSVSPFIVSSPDGPPTDQLAYVNHVDDIGLLIYPSTEYVHAKVPFAELVRVLPVAEARRIAKLHNIKGVARATKPTLALEADSHSCLKCQTGALFTVYSPIFTERPRTTFPPVPFESVEEYITALPEAFEAKLLTYVAHVDDVGLLAYPSFAYVHARMTLPALMRILPITEVRSIAKMHGINAGVRPTKAQLSLHFEGHSCEKCHLFVLVLRAADVPTRDPRLVQREQLLQYRTELSEVDKALLIEDARLRMEAHREGLSEQDEALLKEQARLRMKEFREGLSEQDEALLKEQARLRTKEFRAGLSEDDKALLKEQARLEMKEFRAGLSEDDKALLKEQARLEMKTFRAGLSEQDKALLKEQARLEMKEFRAGLAEQDKALLKEQAKLEMKTFRAGLSEQGAAFLREEARLGMEELRKGHSDKDKARFREEARVRMEELASFPPKPLDKDLAHAIVSGYCEKMSAKNIEEAGCAVCGQLVRTVNLSRLSGVKNFLHILEAQGVTRKERRTSSDEICGHDGPVLDYECDSICNDCRRSVRNGVVPRNALARGLWLGAVPPELSSLRWVERLLIARVRTTVCYMKIAKGLHKMNAHALAFQSPIPHVYAALPPPREDMDDVLAILFTGPCKPTKEDFERAPMLVRRNHVLRALEWLKLNHIDYADIDISLPNLAGYPEDVPPVAVQYQSCINNKASEGTSVFDKEEEDGVKEGECAFIVHGLTGEKIDTMNSHAIVARAMQHLNSDKKFLKVGHSNIWESLWHNPQLYPQMFPWLFPYGLGGIGTARKDADEESPENVETHEKVKTGMSDTTHKRHLMMYHDKRFQKDLNFPFIAFSHEQVAASTSKSFVVSERKNFDEISRRVLSLDPDVLNDLATRMAAGEYVKPETEAQKTCYQVINDLDAISGNVDGSITKKKFMRNEIWSLIAHRGAPSWFITLSPADNLHPISLYYSGSSIPFKPELFTEDQQKRLAGMNPAAGARFFHVLVETFITEVLGVGSSHRGLYGDTSAYYGTVEQQGRLALHLHLLLWLRGCRTPQEIREKIMDPNSDWQRKVVAWLESCHAGEFSTGSQQEVQERVKKAANVPGYKDPTTTLPTPPPPLCKAAHDSEDAIATCARCSDLETWWKDFDNTVDDLLTKSNIHDCERNKKKDGSKKKTLYVGCMDNKYGRCKSRFPKELFEQSEVDPETGALNIKHGEPMLNTTTPAVTYGFRCNTDVTCLLSGTAVKAVVMYISDYITKVSLRTHVMFDSIRSLFTKHTELLGGSKSSEEKARCMMTKIVNLLATKMELGAPMICMYLMGNPDHYTDHTFKVFHWQSYVSEARRPWNTDKAEDTEEDQNSLPEQVMLVRQKGRIVPLSKVNDYICRSPELEDMNLYEFSSRCERKPLPKSTPKAKKTSANQKLAEGAYAGEGSEASEPEAAPNNGEAPRKLGKGMYAFTDKHPLHKSHGLKVIPANDKIVTNFIGATLPRCDQGDREYYCSTMLTLFKPWRSGLDLKSKNTTWDDTFMNHRFSPRQKTVMKNFNIRYECLDARDDYRAQMKKNAEIDPNFDIRLMQDFDIGVGDPYGTVFPDGIALNDDDLPDHLLGFGKNELNRQKNMATYRSMLHNAGWTDQEPSSEQSAPLEQGEPTRALNGKQWAAEVLRKKEAAKEDRFSRMNASRSARNARHGPNSDNPTWVNEVMVDDKSYFERRRHRAEYKAAIDTITTAYCLNSEQERAFRIVANHASSPNPEPLKMYIGGMGGTGKSQVLKALAQFFADRNESHRFIVVGPTGTSAALLGGSTYHSMFGMNDRNQKTSLPAVLARLQGVDYVFLDEVSMLSAQDMYKISAKLALVFDKPDTPFGGLNMIFAGDFAQLPPAIGGENASLYSRVIGSVTTALLEQEKAIGKGLWHQVTTVVILRQNMRQTGQSEADIRFRKALENLRFKACTDEDVRFIRSLISSILPGVRSICDPEFRNVSIITAFNVHKDEINRLGSIRFAAETGQELTHFYSEDSAKRRVGDTSDQPKLNDSSTFVKISKITDALQDALWKAPPCTTDKHIAGTLSLCLGLPVMIRANSATELCMTRGQEGTVWGWKMARGSRKQRILDVLFVKLANPPSKVQFDGLPENVVPLSRTSNPITCSLSNDCKVNITRSQVEILPNFAMTDFASQGKTRGYNPVDLNNLRNHQSYYTALSRSATAKGTVILQGFHPYHMQGGASGPLRQEFRELDLLDEITRSLYDGTLDSSVSGHTRIDLIGSYRKFKGKLYIPDTVHPSLRWNDTNDLWLEPKIEVPAWRIATEKDVKAYAKKEKTHFMPALGSKPTVGATVNDRKRQTSVTVEDAQKFEGTSRPKRPRPGAKRPPPPPTIPPHLPAVPPQRLYSPIGTEWSQNSCAYDSTFSVLHAIWHSDKVRWSQATRVALPAMIRAAFRGFEQHSFSHVSLESVRDDWRRSLRVNDPADAFVWGRYTAVGEVLAKTLQTDTVIETSHVRCLNMTHVQGTSRTSEISSLALHADGVPIPSIAAWVTDNRVRTTNHTCRHAGCNQLLFRFHSFVNVPDLLTFEFAQQSVNLDLTFQITKDGRVLTFDLRGVIYFGLGHYISRIMGAAGSIWIHDGMETGRASVFETYTSSAPNLGVCRGKRATAAMYVLRTT